MVSQATLCSRLGSVSVATDTSLLYLLDTLLFSTKDQTDIFFYFLQTGLFVFSYLRLFHMKVFRLKVFVNDVHL